MKTFASTRRGLVWFAVVLLPLLPHAASGLGVRIPNQDAEAIARGNAFVATANNPSALYYNPAGITQLEGHNLQIGVLNYLGVTSQYESPTGARTSTDFEVVPVPQFYYTYTPKNGPVSLGLGVYAPFGLGLNWPESSGFRTLAIEGRLQYITINPVIAYKAHRTLSLAVGPTINYSKLTIRRGLQTATDVFNFKGDDFAYGFNAGALWQPHEKWSFGANYRSATTVDYSGHTSYSLSPAPPAATSARFEYPQIISAGISYRPTPKWNLEVNVDWTDWDTLNSVTLDGTRNLGFPGDLALAFNWQASWFYEAGVTRYFDNGYFLSAGYFFSSVTTTEKDFNPVVPDTELHVGSVGGGYKGQHWRWALAGQIITGPNRSINNGTPANGKYRFIVPALTVSVGYHF